MFRPSKTVLSACPQSCQVCSSLFFLCPRLCHSRNKGTEWQHTSWGPYAGKWSIPQPCINMRRACLGPLWSTDQKIKVNISLTSATSPWAGRERRQSALSPFHRPEERPREATPAEGKMKWNLSPLIFHILSIWLCFPKGGKSSASPRSKG